MMLRVSGVMVQRTFFDHGIDEVSLPPGLQLACRVALPCILT